MREPRGMYWPQSKTFSCYTDGLAPPLSVVGACDAT